jgi:phosphoribosylamine--glycine ligase
LGTRAIFISSGEYLSMPKKANILVVGSGGRDDRLARKYAQNPDVITYFAPGHAGIEYTQEGKQGRIIRVPLKEPGDIAGLHREIGIDLVDVGPEGWLSNGIVDACYGLGIPAIGPLSEYTRIESDREFTDIILSEIGEEKFGDPYTIKPEWKAFTNPEEAVKYAKEIGYQVVVKANGLAEGKGAIVCNDTSDAIEAIKRIMKGKKIFGDSGNKIVIEERKYGEEISFFAYLDGKNVWPFRVFAKDYKQAFDPDDLAGMFVYQHGLYPDNIKKNLQKMGLKLEREIEKMTDSEKIEYLNEFLNKSGAKLLNPNTGGTGCIAPHKLAEPELVDRIINEIVFPFTDKIYGKGWNYRGVLYFGLNLDSDNKLDVFEINVRHGDPEAEVLLGKLQNDLFNLGKATWEGRLDKIEQRWNDNYYVDVIAMTGRAKSPSGGWFKPYPGRYGKGYRIEGLDDMDKDISVFYAGVEKDEDRGLVSSGGRVLHIVASSPDSKEAIEKSYSNIGRLEFLDHRNNNENILRYRKTIGLDLLE